MVHHFNSGFERNTQKYAFPKSEECHQTREFQPIKSWDARGCLKDGNDSIHLTNDINLREVWMEEGEGNNPTRKRRMKNVS